MCLPMELLQVIQNSLNFIKKINSGSQKAAFGARSCTKAAKMVLRAPQMTHIPSDYQSNLIAGGAHPTSPRWKNDEKVVAAISFFLHMLNTAWIEK